jgi:hypothetical protein
MGKPDKALLNMPCHGGMIDFMDLTNDAAEIAREFPGWDAWQGIDRLWHARIRGAVPPVMVHGEDLVDLRDQIIRYMGRSESDTG